MTTTVKVTTNGNYVATVKINDEDKGVVGPGSMRSRDFGIPHGDITTIEIEEREATAEEVEASNQTGADADQGGDGAEVQTEAKRLDKDDSAV